jgi:hypothetical protein
MQIEYFELPTFWATALFYDDRTGLDDEDGAALDAFLAGNPTLSCVDMDDNIGFTRWHDAARYGVLACDCATFTFYKTP